MNKPSDLPNPEIHAAMLALGKAARAAARE